MERATHSLMLPEAFPSLPFVLSSSFMSYIPSLGRNGHCSNSILPSHLVSPIVTDILSRKHMLRLPDCGRINICAKFKLSWGCYAHRKINLKSPATQKSRSVSSKILRRSNQGSQHKARCNRQSGPAHRQYIRCRNGTRRHTRPQHRRSRDRRSARRRSRACCQRGRTYRRPR